MNKQINFIDATNIVGNKKMKLFKTFKFCKLSFFTIPTQKLPP